MYLISIAATFLFPRILHALQTVNSEMYIQVAHCI